MKLQFLTARSYTYLQSFHFSTISCSVWKLCQFPFAAGHWPMSKAHLVHYVLKKFNFLSTVLSGGEIWKDLILVYLDDCSTNVWKYTFICLHLTSTYLGNCSTFQIGSPDFPLPWQLQYKGMKACFHIALPDFHEFMNFIVPTSTW